MVAQESSRSIRVPERQMSRRVRFRTRVIPAGQVTLLVAMTYLLLPPLALASSIVFVQVHSAVPQSRQTSVSVTYAKAQTAGDLNIVVVGWNDSTAEISSVKDSQGNAYILAVGPTVQSGLATQAIYYAKNIWRQRQRAAIR